MSAKRALPVAGLLVAVVIVLVLVFSGGSDNSYRVRAIFNNAFGLIPGEDVKVAGVKVGTVESMDVTDGNKAAVVLKIEDPGFTDFRSDASCRIRPQSLIGEKFVECKLTEPTAVGQQQAAPLPKIPEGKSGAGQYLLPVTNTSASVDLDLINNVMRRPYRERLALIINEFGTGLAGRGEDLNQAIRRSNPALEQTDKVLKALADQNQVLADLAQDSDTVIAPLAARKKEVADFIVQANTTSQSLAQRRADLKRHIELLPDFLDQLKPTMASLESVSNELTPVAADLNASASDISRVLAKLDDFSDAGVPAFKTLGQAADDGNEALDKADPVISDLNDTANSAISPSSNLNKLLTSFNETGGPKRLFETLFYSATSANGYDSLGHFQRAFLVANDCIAYSTVKSSSGSCIANFGKASTESKRSAKKLQKLTVPADTDSNHQPTTTPQDPAATPDEGATPDPSAPVSEDGQLEADAAMLAYLFGGSE